jgi:hypothetical protein
MWLGIVEHAHATSLSLAPGIPAVLPAETGILGILQNGYLLALGLAGVLAVGSILWGAIQYTLSRGNPAQLADALDRMLQAFIGIVLLVGAGTILSIVNPGLLSLELPKLVRLQEKGYQQGTAQTIDLTFEDEQAVNTKAPAPTIPSTSSCKADPSKCVSLSQAGLTCKHRSSCTAHVQITQALQCAANQVGISMGSLRVTEAYPPGSNHVDQRHNNGCAIDITMGNDFKKGGCDAIKRFTAAIYSCGGSALNEYAGPDSGGMDFTGCAPRTKYWTANHIHVNGCPRGTI